MPSRAFLWEYAFRDLFRQKTRTILGILGVSVSIFLLTSVAFMTDSVSSSFTDYLTTDAGGQDLNLYVRHYNGEPRNRSSFFDYSLIENQIRANVSEVDVFIPRMSTYVFINKTSRTSFNLSQWEQITALDFSYEESINFGAFSNLAPGVNPKVGLPPNSCIVTSEFAEAFMLNPGDNLSIYISNIRANLNLTVLSTYSHTLKFPSYDDTMIVVDLAWWGETLNAIKTRQKSFDYRGKCNELIMLLTDREKIYDIRDIEGSERYIVNVGGEILSTLGIEGWTLEYPKLENLYFSEFLTIGTQILFILISFISMLIAGILINGLLSTSVEERIREYGINRVLGAQKSYNLKLILIQGILIAVFGTTLGVLLAGGVVGIIVLPIINNRIPEGLLSSRMSFVAQPLSIFTSYAIGVGVSIFVSIFPALKVMKMQIVEAINPYRHEEAVYKLVRDTSVNSKLILFGTVLAGNGLFIYLLIPRMLLSFEIGLIIGTLLATMMIFLIGISLLAIGLIPVIIRFLLFVLKPISKKLDNIIRITIFRYQRRNISTTILFVLSFSFILFTTSMVEIQTKQVGAFIQYNSGSDLQVIPTTYDIKAPTLEMQEKLMEVEGIERSSALLVSLYDLEQIYAEEDKEFDAELGDYINFDNRWIRPYGIDPNYKDVVYSQNYMTFTEGIREQAFEQVFVEGELNIIISTALSNELDLRVGDISRLTFYRGDEQEIAIATIVGVASHMPGLNRFKISSYEADYGGVIMSNTNYIRYFNIPGGDNAYIDRIFVKVMEGYDPADVEARIIERFENEYDIFVRNTARGIESSEEAYTTIKYVLTGILISTVIIGLFGLIASAYSSILERRREIAITRTLGLYPSDINRMFLLESMILLLSSGGAGGIIGVLLSYLLSQNMILFTESPSVFALPWDIVGIIVGFSLLVLIWGMNALLRKLKKQNLIEIYRMTL